MTDHKLQFGIVAYYEQIDDFLDWITEAERLGFDLVGYGDTQNLSPDLYVALAGAAIKTSRIRIGSTVTNPVTRHPAVTASAMAGIQVLSQGRVFCGIGTGDSALRTIGEQPATLDHLREYCQTLRGLCAGREVDYRGQRFRLQWLPQPVPIWIAAEGPRTMRLAGQIADGVIFANGATEEVIKNNIRCVREGAESVGRDPDEIELWFMVKPYFVETEEQAWREVSWTLAASANHAFGFTMEGKFVPEQLQDGIRGLRRDYAPHEHNKSDPGRGDHNASLVERYGLTEFLGRRFLIAGPPRRIVERIEELAGWGARNLIFTAIFGDKLAYTRRLAEEVLPAFR